MEMSNCPNGLPDLIASRAFVNNNDGCRRSTPGPSNAEVFY